MKVANKIFSQEQHEKLHELWRKYGNNGKEHSLKGHKFIQSLIENLDKRMKSDSFNVYFFKLKKFYGLKKTDLLYKEVYAIINNCL